MTHFKPEFIKMEEKSMMEPRIPMYIAVWLESGCGNESRGIWLPLPATKKEFLAAQEAIYVEYSNIYIMSYNVRIPGVGRDMLLSASLGRANYLASRIMALDNEQLMKLAAIYDSDRYFDSLEQYIDYTYNHDSYTLIPGVKNPADLGRMYLDGEDFAAVPGDLKKCIDPYKLGANIAKAVDGQFTALGYLTTENGWSAAPKARKTPAALDLTGSKGESLFGIRYSRYWPDSEYYEDETGGEQQ